jgi:uncharacterized protein
MAQIRICQRSSHDFLQFQMLIPAAVAIFLQRYIFKDSRLYFRNYRERPRWFFSLYLVFTVFVLALVFTTALKPDLYPMPLANLFLAALPVTLLAILVIRRLSGKQAFQQAGLSGGKWASWLVILIAVTGYLFIQTLLNMALKLGAQPDILSMASELGMNAPAFLIAGFLNTAIIGPLLGLLVAFGEEYGWRGYLQGELIKLGRIRGVLLVGLVWGIWHAPVVAMGHNYPGYPILGPIAFLIFNLALAIILGYVMLKTNSVWLVAWMHGLINSSYAWLIMIVYTPDDALFSFGAGIYGILFAWTIAILLLRDRVWK